MGLLSLLKHEKRFCLRITCTLFCARKSWLDVLHFDAYPLLNAARGLQYLCKSLHLDSSHVQSLEFARFLLAR